MLLLQARCQLSSTAPHEHLPARITHVVMGRPVQALGGRASGFESQSVPGLPETLHTKHLTTCLAKYSLLPGRLSTLLAPPAVHPQLEFCHLQVQSAQSFGSYLVDTCQALGADPPESFLNLPGWLFLGAANLLIRGKSAHLFAGTTSCSSGSLCPAGDQAQSRCSAKCFLNDWVLAGTALNRQGPDPVHS